MGKFAGAIPSTLYKLFDACWPGSYCSETFVFSPFLEIYCIWLFCDRNFLKICVVRPWEFLPFLSPFLIESWRDKIYVEGCARCESEIFRDSLVHMDISNENYELRKHSYTWVCNCRHFCIHTVNVNRYCIAENGTKRKTASYHLLTRWPVLMRVNCKDQSFG